MRYLNLKITAKINSKTIQIPLNGGLGLAHLAEQEAWMNQLLEELILPLQNKLFLDVGVNIGQTLVKVKTLFPDISYIGIEPNPFCLYYLQQLISFNDFKSTTVLPVALADSTNVFQLLFDNESLTDSSAGIIDTYRKGKFRKLDIMALNASDIPFLKQQNIGLIKIDVEGAELEVLTGLEEIIQLYRPVIVIEILPVYSVQNTERLKRQNQLQKLIENLEYEIYRINEANANLNKIDQLDIHSDLSLCNYVLRPKISSTI